MWGPQQGNLPPRGVQNLTAFSPIQTKAQSPHTHKPPGSDYTFKPSQRIPKLSLNTIGPKL